MVVSRLYYLGYIMVFRLYYLDFLLLLTLYITINKNTNDQSTIDYYSTIIALIDTDAELRHEPFNVTMRSAVPPTMQLAGEQSGSFFAAHTH